MTIFQHLREIRATRNRKLNRLEKNREIRPALVVSEGGQTTYNALGDNYTWISFSNQVAENRSPAWNKTTLREAGQAVLVARSPKAPFRWEIISANDVYEQETSAVDVSRFEVGIHGDNHAIPSDAAPGPDPTWVYQAALMMLKTFGDGATLSVTTYPYSYIVNGQRKYFPGVVTDLTSYVPAAGLIRKVLLYLDRSTGIFPVVSGTAVLDNGIIPIPEPIIPAGVDGTESAWVTLANGQTAITTGTDIIDARDFLKNGQSSVTIPAPTEQGQILIADDSLNWIAAKPLVGDNGDILTGDNDEIVYSG